MDDARVFVLGSLVVGNRQLKGQIDAAAPDWRRAEGCSGSVGACKGNRRAPADLHPPIGGDGTAGIGRARSIQRYGYARVCDLVQSGSSSGRAVHIYDTSVFVGKQLAVGYG